MNLDIKYINGIKMKIPCEQLTNSLDSLSIYNEYIQQMNMHFPEFVIEPNDIFVDVGSHVGFFAIPLMINNPNINCYCYEASAFNFGLLERNIYANNIDPKRITTSNFAISSTQGVRLFSEGVSSTTGHFSELKLYKRTVGANEKRYLKRKNSKNIKIITKSLDQVFEEAKINICKLLKIDIEGGEHLVFQGSQLFLRHTKYLVMELHPVDGFSPDIIINNIQNAGFTIKTRKYENGCSILYCNNLNN